MSARDVLDRVATAARPAIGVSVSRALRRFAFDARSAAQLAPAGDIDRALVDAAGGLFAALGAGVRARAAIEAQADRAHAATRSLSGPALASWLAEISPLGRDDERAHAAYLVACVCAALASDEDDVAWLLARERGEETEHPDPERAAGYVRLEDMLRSLPGREPPPGWQEKVLAKLPPDTWWRRLWQRLSRWARRL